MQDVDLLLSLAEIAGMFVGFGALISIRSASTSDWYEVAYVRGVVGLAIMVIIAALAPVLISRYGIIGHELWVVCSLLVLALFWGVALADNRMPEHRAVVAARRRATSFVRPMLVALPLHIALILVVLGLFPDQEQALYLTAVVVVLFSAASFLLELVYSQGRPAAA